MLSLTDSRNEGSRRRSRTTSRQAGEDAVQIPQREEPAGRNLDPACRAPGIAAREVCEAMIRSFFVRPISFRSPQFCLFFMSLYLLVGPPFLPGPASTDLVRLFFPLLFFLTSKYCTDTFSRSRHCPSATYHLHTLHFIASNLILIHIETTENPTFPERFGSRLVGPWAAILDLSLSRVLRVAPLSSPPNHQLLLASYPHLSYTFQREFLSLGHEVDRPACALLVDGRARKRTRDEC